MLIERGRFGLSWTVLIFQVDDNAGCAVIEGVHHLAFVERHPIAGRAAEAVTADRPNAFPLLKLRARAEQPGVVGHVEHRRVSTAHTGYVRSASASGRRPRRPSPGTHQRHSRPPRKEVIHTPPHRGGTAHLRDPAPAPRAGTTCSPIPHSTRSTPAPIQRPSRRLSTVMTRIQAAVAALCVLSLLVAIAALLQAPTRGAQAYWCIAILCSAAWLIDLRRTRRRAHRLRNRLPFPAFSDLRSADPGPTAVRREKLQEVERFGIETVADGSFTHRTSPR